MICVKASTLRAGVKGRAGKSHERPGILRDRAGEGPGKPLAEGYAIFVAYTIDICRNWR